MPDIFKELWGGLARRAMDFSGNHTVKYHVSLGGITFA